MNTSQLALRTQKSLHVCNAFAFWCRTSRSTPFLPIIPITTPCCLWHLCFTISAFRKELGELHREAHPPVRGSFPLIQGYFSFFRCFQISFLGGHLGDVSLGELTQFQGAEGCLRASSPAVHPGHTTRSEAEAQRHAGMVSVYTCCWAKSLCSPHNQSFRVLPFLFQPWPLFLFVSWCLNTSP